MSPATLTRRLPWLLMGLAFLAAWTFTSTDSEIIRHYAAGVFGASLGGALTLWGLSELKAGKIRGKGGYVLRSDSPVVFFSLIMVTRFFPGLAMLLATFWHLAIKQG